MIYLHDPIVFVVSAGVSGIVVAEQLFLVDKLTLKFDTNRLLGSGIKDVAMLAAPPRLTKATFQ